MHTNTEPSKPKQFKKNGEDTKNTPVLQVTVAIFLFDHHQLQSLDLDLILFQRNRFHWNSLRRVARSSDPKPSVCAVPAGSSGATCHWLGRNGAKLRPELPKDLDDKLRPLQVKQHLVPHLLLEVLRKEEHLWIIELPKWLAPYDLHTPQVRHRSKQPHSEDLDSIPLLWTPRLCTWSPENRCNRRCVAGSSWPPQAVDLFAYACQRPNAYHSPILSRSFAICWAYKAQNAIAGWI